ncbi:MAG: hypothetical protein M3Q97_08255, partial [Bacteroidota bacterium]|nr:hypothetical protein [Bacteroidota bacterium]
MTWENYVYGQKVTSMEEDVKRYYIGTKGGLIVIDKITEEVKVLNKANSPLPSNMIETVEKDALGNIWVGTYDAGVALYNGTSWTVLDKENSDLPRNEVLDIKSDGNGDIWIGTYGGIVHVEGSKWTVIGTDTDINYQLFQIAVDESRGDVWFVGTHTIKQFDGEKFIDHSGQTGSYSQQRIVKDPGNNIWIFNPGVISKFDGQQWTRYNTTDENVPGTGHFNGMCLTPEGNILVSRGSDFLTFENNTWSAGNAGLSTNDPQYLTFDNEGKLWIGQGDKMLIRSNEGQILESFEISNAFFKSNYIEYVATGSDGLIWAADLNSRISYFKDGVWSYLHDNPAFDSTRISGIKALPGGGIAVATISKGLFLYKNDHWVNYSTTNSDMVS